MTTTTGTLSRSPPYLAPNTNAYKLAQALYHGETLRDACKRLRIRHGAAYVALGRLRKEAREYAGFPVSEVFALRLVFDAEQAEKELSEIRSQKDMS